MCTASSRVAVCEDGRVRDAGQIQICGEAIRMFADSFGPEDEVAIEATRNPHSTVRLAYNRGARVGVIVSERKIRIQAATSPAVDVLAGA